MALTTHRRLKEMLGIKADDTNKDVICAELVERESALISAQCHRVFEAATYTEYYDGDGLARILPLRQYPVVSVASLYDDPERAYGSTTLIAATDYVTDLPAGLITLDGFAFDRGLQNIKVTYTAGYTVIPQDLEEACLYRCQAAFLETQGELNVSVEFEMANRIGKLRDEAQRIIERYVRHAL